MKLTQTVLAERLGVTFATVNRWENAKSKPSQLSWNQLLLISQELSRASSGDSDVAAQSDKPPMIDFAAAADVVTAVVEGVRLSLGHLANPAFAAETARIDPLPHQRIAVDEHMLKQRSLRFLLADDAGAGKTIMTGLYIRHMLLRRAIRRVLIIPPAGLVGNWRQELLDLFGLSFNIVSGADAKICNPFVGPGSDRVIVSVDTLAADTMFNRLAEEDVVPYDLAVFDEAHKLSCNRSSDLRIDKTGRYKLAEAIAGAASPGEGRFLLWRASHLLLLTATPHMGKDYPYFALWRLLKPDVLTTLEAFEQFSAERRKDHFIRRTKEEMVRRDGSPIYPKRISDTLDFQLSQGEVSEQKLYDETTEYLKNGYGRGSPFKSNSAAAKLTMGVFQRRLASSTHALFCSFKRRIEKLDAIINQVQSGEITMEQLMSKQKQYRDVFDSKSADDEQVTASLMEESRAAEDRLLMTVTVTTLSDLIAEVAEVKELCNLAEQVLKTGRESKFERLRELIKSEDYSSEKILVFTEHKDTLEFLVSRLDGLGYTGQIAQIHGGMHYTERQDQIDIFRKPIGQGGARFMLCTDAAAEGVNLQFCWIMINYDIPWNPARLEQRMGRIHRYGQKHDPVIIINLVARDTREGKVLKTLLVKLDKIREEMNSGKVFDSIGRIFNDISIKNYMERIVAGDDLDLLTGEIENRLTTEGVNKIMTEEQSNYGESGDVVKELSRLGDKLDQELHLHLLPTYVSNFIRISAPLTGLKVEGDIDGHFNILPTSHETPDPFQDGLHVDSSEGPAQVFALRPDNLKHSTWMHPGSASFDRLNEFVSRKLGRLALQGAVFVDPKAEHPYLFHLARLSVVRKADPAMVGMDSEKVIDCRLMAIKQTENSEISICPPEHLLFLMHGQGLPAIGQPMAANAQPLREKAYAYISEQQRGLTEKFRSVLEEDLHNRESEMRSGISFKQAGLARERSKMSKKSRQGDEDAASDLERVKTQQRSLLSELDDTIAAIRREPELIAPGELTFIAHALVVPSNKPEDLEWRENNVEKIAMDLVKAYEEAAGAKVSYVHTTDLARKVGYSCYPGFDILSKRPMGEDRCIEVKGRSGKGEIQMTSNEWLKAGNLGKACWLYVVYHCDTAEPKLLRVQDPYSNILFKRNNDGQSGGVRINHTDILAACQQ